MLELYHGGHTTCSRKARLCLKEKGLAYTSHFLNLRGFEQHAPAYLKLNPNGVVPTLIDDGEAVVNSMLINEYLDEKYDQHTRLRPNNPLDKARMRVWTKLASDHGLSGVVPRVWPTFKVVHRQAQPERAPGEARPHPAHGTAGALGQGRARRLRRAGPRRRPQGRVADPDADGSRTRQRPVADGRRNTRLPTSISCRSSTASRSSIRTCSTSRPRRRSRPGSRACASGRR